jgi:hypothetical protein
LQFNFSNTQIDIIEIHSDPVGLCIINYNGYHDGYIIHDYGCMIHDYGYVYGYCRYDVNGYW